MALAIFWSARIFLSKLFNITYFFLSVKGKISDRHLASKKPSLAKLTVIFNTKCQSRLSINRDMEELDSDQPLSDRRIRQPGGGRKRAMDQIKGLESAFLRVIESHTAGSPFGKSRLNRHI